MKKRLSVLFVANNLDAGSALDKEFHDAGYEAEYHLVGEAEEVAESCVNASYDIVLADYSKACLPANDLLKAVRASAIRTPVIIISEPSNRDMAGEAMKSGASDFIVMDSPGRLLPAIERELRGVKVLGELDFAKKELSGKRVLLDYITSSIQASVIALDSTGKVLFWNDSSERIFGFGSDETIGSRLHELIIPDRYKEEHIRDFKDALGEHSTPFAHTPTEVTLRDKAGTEFQASCAITSVKSGNNCNTVAVIRNIAEEDKSGEAQCRANKEMKTLLRKIEIAKEEWGKTVDCIKDNFVILTDPEGRIIRCNLAFKNFTGLPFNVLLGKDWESLLAVRNWESCRITDNSYELHHQGTGGWYVMHTYPYMKGGGDSSAGVGTVIIIHDITELKNITAEIEKKNTELEKAYEELKHTQANIIQHEKMASIGHLAAGVAHEINNPMSFISSNLQSLMKYTERLLEFIDIQGKALGGDSASEEDIENARKRLKVDYLSTDIVDMIGESLEGAERVKKIVLDLKGFSRKAQTAELEFADIHELLDSTINIIWNEIKYKGTLTREYGDVPGTRCYSQQLSQVFMNLLINAAQALEKDGEITIRTSEERGVITVSIRDTGEGIPEENIDLLFDPFFTTKEEGKGTGLGLSISYDIIKKHGGKITVESDIGKGSTFTVHIPLLPDEA